MSPRSHPGEKIKNICGKSWGGSWGDNRDAIIHFISPMSKKPGFHTLKNKHKRFVSIISLSSLKRQTAV